MNLEEPLRAITWSEIKQGMILKAEDDRNYIWSLVLTKTSSEVFLVTYYQLMPKMRGKGYAGSSGTGLDFEYLSKRQWADYAMWIVPAMPNSIKRPFIKKMFTPEDDWS